MPTIGLDNIVYSKITDGEDGETYAAPKKLAKAIKADITVEYAEGEIYADDALSENAKEFRTAKLAIEVDDIGAAAASDLTGATVDKNGVLINTDADNAPYVAIGFRSKKSNGAYRYFWLYRGKFGVPGDSLATKGNSISYATKTIEGTFIRREKAVNGKHPWKATVDSDDTGVSQPTITGWFGAVYEPEYAEAGA